MTSRNHSHPRSHMRCHSRGANAIANAVACRESRSSSNNSVCVGHFAFPCYEGRHYDAARSCPTTAEGWGMR
jgi:hypothetical protein